MSDRHVSNLLTPILQYPSTSLYSAFADESPQSSQAADVEAELQQYLNSNNINSLFIAIVESLLVDKPTKPIAFMIEYLHRHFPEEAKLAMEGLSKCSSG